MAAETRWLLLGLAICSGLGGKQTGALRTPPLPQLLPAYSRKANRQLSKKPLLLFFILFFSLSQRNATGEAVRRGRGTGSFAPRALSSVEAGTEQMQTAYFPSHRRPAQPPPLTSLLPISRIRTLSILGGRHHHHHNHHGACSLGNWLINERSRSLDLFVRPRRSVLRALSNAWRSQPYFLAGAGRRAHLSQQPPHVPPPSTWRRRAYF